jgi:hypothetical protein
MLVHLFIAGAILALIVGVGESNADPQPEPMLVPPVSLACISSPFGPRLLANHPGAGAHHQGIDLPAPSDAFIAAGRPVRCSSLAAYLAARLKAVPSNLDLRLCLAPNVRWGQLPFGLQAPLLERRAGEVAGCRYRLNAAMSGPVLGTIMEIASAEAIKPVFKGGAGVPAIVISLGMLGRERCRNRVQGYWCLNGFCGGSVDWFR